MAGTSLEYDARSCHPGKDKYFTSRMLGHLDLIYGPRGKTLIAFYSYFRWVDNVADSTLSISEKEAFLERQKLVIEGKIPENSQPIETEIGSMDLSFLSGQTQQLLRLQGQVLLSSFKDDVDHSDFLPRNRRQIRHYNWRTMLPCVQAAGIILNGHEIKPTRDFMRFLDIWNIAGSLADISEDVQTGHKFQLPLETTEANDVANAAPDERRQKIAQIYDCRRFNREKADVTAGIIEYTSSFLQLDLPLWQKALSMLYMVRAIAKVQLKARYVPLENLT